MQIQCIIFKFYMEVGSLKLSGCSLASVAKCPDFQEFQKLSCETTMRDTKSQLFHFDVLEFNHKK